MEGKREGRDNYKWVRCAMPVWCSMPSVLLLNIFLSEKCQVYNIRVSVYYVHYTMYNVKLSILSPLYIRVCNYVVYEPDYQIPAAGGASL